jgi:CPA1 family monovalent cation:H+ antiporter
VIGVVMAGMILGNFGSRIGMNPRTRLIVTEFWEFLAFFVNSIVFLLIGDQIQFASLGNNLDTIAITIAAVAVTRAVSIYLLGGFSNWVVESNINWQERTVLWWGGLRGSVSIALALSVPIILDAREEIIATVFGVVLFTLLVQGLTTKPLLKALNLLGEQSQKQQYLEAIARRIALTRVLERLEEEKRRPDIDPEYYRYQKSLVEGQIKELEREIEELRSQEPDLQEFVREKFREELLAIEADTYAEFVRSGRLNRELAPFLQDVIQEEKT